jgi:hypothetical protein
LLIAELFVEHFPVDDPVFMLFAEVIEKTHPLIARNLSGKHIVLLFASSARCRAYSDCFFNSAQESVAGCSK